MEYHKSLLHRQRVSAVHKGKVISEEQKQKQSEAMKRLYASGYKHPRLGVNHSEEAREKIRQGHLGTHVSDFVKQRVKEAQTGKIVSKETRNKMSVARLGMHLSSITKDKLSEAAKKRYENEDYKRKISETKKRLFAEGKIKSSFLGRKHTEEAKRKISQMNKGRLIGDKNPFYRKHHSEENLEKNRLAHLGKHNLKGISKSEEHKRKISEIKKILYSEGKIKAWNKGLTKETDKRVLDGSIKLSIKKHGKTFVDLYGKEKSDQMKNKLSLIHKTINNSGRFKESEEHPCWLGGISFIPYTKEFNNRFKKFIKERDGCCMVCNISLEDLGMIKRRSHVHHIDYNKLNSLPQNCITLCHSCHCKTNFNRSHWTPFFQSILKERYNYQYTDNHEILFNFNMKGGPNENA
jgi:hypothetical protein